MKSRATLIITTTILAAVACVSFGRAASAATTSPVAALSAGSKHSCALHADGTVQCWGSNEFGQLGNEEVAASSTPVPVALPADAHIVAIAAGAFHTCAIARDHRVFCWGSNGWGSLGIGDAPSQPIPQLVTLAPTDAAASDIAAGGFTSCVLLSDGRAQCWGRNQYGEVGDWTRTLRNLPTPVIGVNDAVDIDAGDNHVCVLRSVGRMQCWGRNGDGRAGDSTMSNIAEISTGAAHTCARTTTGGLRCWGTNAYGQLTPNNIDAGVARVSAGGNHTCVVGETGTVMCWGDSSLGQLGDFDAEFASRFALEVAAGALHTCARFDDSSVWCWGHSLSGQAGDHVLTSASNPVQLIEAVTPAQLPDPTQPDPTQPDSPQSNPAQPDPAQPDATPAEPAPATPVADEPADATPADGAPNEAPSVPVEKQATTPGASSDAPSAAMPGPAPSRTTEQPSALGGPSIPRLRYVDLRLGQQVGVVRLARKAGVRLPSTMIASSLSRSRSVSAHPFNGLRVEATVSHVRNCRNVLTATLGAAVRATRVGECRVTLRIVRAGRPPLVRTVVIRTAAFAAPMNNPARNTR